MTDVTEVPESAAAPAPMARIQVRLGDLGLAKENLRYAEAADDGVPQLAEIILAAGVVIPPIVRAGRKSEEPFMALDGRRRRLGSLALRDRGDITDDYLVECLLAETKAQRPPPSCYPTPSTPRSTWPTWTWPSAGCVRPRWTPPPSPRRWATPSWRSSGSRRWPPCIRRC